MFNSIYVEKTFDKIQHPFLVKQQEQVNKVGIKGNFFSLMKDI